MFSLVLLVICNVLSQMVLVYWICALQLVFFICVCVCSAADFEVVLFSILLMLCYMCTTAINTARMIACFIAFTVFVSVLAFVLTSVT